MYEVKGKFIIIYFEYVDIISNSCWIMIGIIYRFN